MIVLLFDPIQSISDVPVMSRLTQMEQEAQKGRTDGMEGSGEGLGEMGGSPLSLPPIISSPKKAEHTGSIRKHPDFQNQSPSVSPDPFSVKK